MRKPVVIPRSNDVLVLKRSFQTVRSSIEAAQEDAQAGAVSATAFFALQQQVAAIAAQLQSIQTQINNLSTSGGAEDEGFAFFVS